MNVDSYFTVGKGHAFCQDYAIAKMHGTASYSHHRPYLIVSDGCSSSPQTDVGARILAHCAERLIQEMYDTNTMLPWEVFGMQVISQAQVCADVMGLQRNCLDATLLVGFECILKSVCDGMTFYIYGDGHVLGLCHAQSLYYMTTKYDHSAPYYLTYMTDLYRRGIYLDQGINRYKRSLADEVEGLKGSIEHVEAQNILFLPYDNYKFLAIGSDGLSSFINTRTGEPCLGHTIMNSFLNFKNTKGEFVKRRVKRAMRDLEKDEQIVPGDDVSLAVLQT